MCSGNVREGIRMNHCWEVLCLVSLGMCFRVISLERARIRLKVSWTFHFLHAHAPCLMFPECVYVERVSVSAASDLLRRYRCSSFFHFWRCPVWLHQCGTHALVRLNQGPFPLFLIEVVTIFQYAPYFPDLEYALR